ncbi:hypothetical protein HDU93_009864 [Gonapodya sp. JEL0774]|nr:hypothetical protein HDU93_009864 [Gonapodya sp. JEL0774]
MTSYPKSPTEDLELAFSNDPIIDALRTREADILSEINRTSQEIWDIERQIRNVAATVREGQLSARKPKNGYNNDTLIESDAGSGNNREHEPRKRRKREATTLTNAATETPSTGTERDSTPVSTFSTVMDMDQLDSSFAKEGPAATEGGLFVAPANSTAIKADVRIFDWSTLAAYGSPFSAVILDPAWQLSSHAPTRGVAIAYATVRDDEVAALPIGDLVREGGFCFLWVVNSRWSWGIRQLAEWGLEFIDTITWVKLAVTRRLAKGHGYYLQHAKETCLVGRKRITSPDPEANVPPCDSARPPDSVFALRRGQSQKPEEIYDIAESLAPNGPWLEIFGRRNNLRSNWVTIGNEL